MNGWVYHGKRCRSNLRVPRPQQGHGWLDEDQPEVDKSFERDEKTGLLLPAGAAKERRKVQIGFRP